MPPNIINVILRLQNAARFAAQVRAARQQLNQFGRAARRAGQQGVGLRVALGGISTGLRLTALGLVVAGQGAVALTLGIVGLTSALGPLLGLVGALPAGLFMVAQAFGVVKLAGLGVTDALGPLSGAIDPDKFAALTRPAQDFVLALDAMKGSVRGLQRDLAGGLFPGVLEGLIAARPALDALHGPLVDTARGTGAWVASLGRLVGSGGFLTDLRSQAAFNNVQLGRLGVAALHLVNVFRNLTVGSRGLVSWIVRGTASFAAWADRTTSAARSTGGLQRGFHTVQVTTQRVVLTLWRFGKALLNIGRIGKREVGDGLLVSLLRGATALERWTRSEAGIRRIGQAFAWSRRILAGVADFMHRAATGAGPELASMLRNIVGALNPIIASGGGVVILSLYAQGISDVAAAIGWFVRNVPGATFVLSAFFAVMILNKVTGVLAVASSILTFAKAVLIAAAGTRLGAAAFWALNAAIYANPIGLIVLGVVAAGAAFYLLYTRVEWFRNAVQNAWSWIKDNWQTLGLILSGPFAPLILAMKWVIENFGKIKGFLGGLPGKALGVLDSINPFAAGGVVNSPFQLVGERGPELAALPIGSRVISAPETRQMLRAPVMPRVSGSPSSNGGAGGPTIIRNYITVAVDKRVLAEAVSDVMADEAAAG